ncbi:MAG: hypothetical protein KF723_20695 [Rhizobiaceae bacterium]|nr:hypothetical protein [Rhizobiaceae bacterium]
MAFTTGFEYDLFISYAHVDDSEKMPTGRGWVSEFVARLQSALHSRLGGPDSLKIYFDHNSLGANHRLPELLDAAAKSAVFVALASPAYAMRDWTRKELSTFASSADDLKRLFAVEFLPLQDGDEYPEPLSMHKRAKFWETDEPHSSTPIPLMPDGSGPYRNRIHDLAQQIRTQLVALNARKEIGALAEAIVDDTARRNKGVVFLAQTTDDLEEDRLQVQRYLEQFGYLVIPRADYPQGGEQFVAAVQDDLRDASLYVHLLGPRGGRRPPDLPLGYARAQFDAARQARVPTMLWRRPDLDLSTVADADHLAILNDADVIASGLESFKADVRRRLEIPRTEPRPLPPPQTLVFINADESDYEVAKMVRDEFAARDMTAVIPMYQRNAAEFHEDLKEHLTDSDVLVFLYGRAPEAWVRQQLKFFSKLRPGAKARVVAVLVGPPEGKPDDLGVSFKGLTRVPAFEDWKVTPILELIDGLQQ